MATNAQHIGFKMPKEKLTFFKSFMTKAIIEGNKFDAGNRQGDIFHYKTQTRRNHKLGNIGDFILIREPTYIDPSGHVWYKRLAELDPQFFEGIKWKSPVFMNKKHARIRLEIIGVRQERLGNISEADCIKEGIFKDGKYWDWEINGRGFKTAQEAFFDLIKFIKKGQEPDLDAMIWVHDFRLVKNGN